MILMYHVKEKNDIIYIMNSKSKQGENKKTYKRKQKGGTNIKDCINKEDPISFEKLENIVKFKVKDPTKKMMLFIIAIIKIH